MMILSRYILYPMSAALLGLVFIACLAHAMGHRFLTRKPSL